MYEVFWNDRKIVIGSSENIQFFKEAVRFENINSSDEVKNWFLNFTRSERVSAVLSHPSPEKFWKEIFVPAFNPVPAAGGIVIRNEKLLFIFRNGKWDLPKGKIDGGESAEEAALREVAEECGIEGHQIIRKLPSTFHIYQSAYHDTFGQWILKETQWFEMSYTKPENGIPQTNENITKIKWFTKSELDEVMINTYENLKSVISVYKK
ncbi:MAG: NUDIX domain-containing protein [Bacteroidetes bacterium]|nr:MAG: NUDIX domain-containing protein [Bacteroidota bacterium]